jgi:hypothetical protein
VLAFDVLIAASTDNSGSGPVRFIITAVGIAIVGAIFAAVAKRRNRKAVDAVAAEAPESFAFVIVPGRPLADQLAQVSAALGGSSEVPKITLYSRPVVTGGPNGIVVSDKKLGVLLTIPVAAITQLDSRQVKVKPHGVIGSATFQAIWVGVRKEGAEVGVALPPVAGMYDSVSPQQALAISTELVARLGLGKA